MEGDEYRLAPRVHVHHRGQQGIDDEMGAVVAHAVELGALRLDSIEHAVDDTGDGLLKLRDAPRRERRDQETANAGMLRAVHLGDELRIHDLVELLPSRAARHLRGECLGVGEHPMHVGIAADHHLGRPAAEHIEWRAARPLGHVTVRVRLELGAAEVDVDDIGMIQFRMCMHYSLSARMCGMRMSAKPFC